MPQANADSGTSATDIARIKAKATLAIAFAICGIVTLVIGLVVLLYGVTEQGFTVMNDVKCAISESGLSVWFRVSMLALWAFSFVFAILTIVTWWQLRD